MPYRVQLFIAGDELSKNMLRIVDKITRLLVERFGPRIKSSSKDYIAYVLTSNTLTLNPKQGASEEFQIEIFFILGTYQEELKTRFNLMDFPAARFNDKTYTGQEALDIISRLHDSLNRLPSISDDELLAEIKRIASQAHVPESRVAAERSSIPSILQKVVELAVKAADRVSSSYTVAEKPRPEAEYAPQGFIDKVVFERNVVRAGIMECLTKLERLREEGRIDENTYRKMKEVYNAFLG